MNGILTIVGLVTALINIILFFKIWGMTNDVDRIYYQVCRITKQVEKTRYEVKFADYYLSGEYEEAYRFLNHCLAYDIHYNFRKFSNGDDKSTQNSESIMSFFRGSSKNVLDDSTSYTDTIAKLIEKYKPLYELIGKEIPDNIKNITYESSRLLYESYKWNVTFR